MEESKMNNALQQTCVGIAVKRLLKDTSPKFVTKASKSKMLVGVPFQGNFPSETIRDYLIDNNYIDKNDYMGNMVFLGVLN
ncbi:hypothetical protein D3C73_1329250 [compost metagenome]